MTAKEADFIQPPNNLRDKQKAAGVALSFDSKVLAHADAAIRRSREDYFESVAEDLVKLQRCHDLAVG